MPKLITCVPKEEGCALPKHCSSEQNFVPMTLLNVCICYEVGTVCYPSNCTFGLLVSGKKFSFI